ncbi:MAG: Ser-Thr-rich GPI-anchored membrane family protein, partial [bacterium]
SCVKSGPVGNWISTASSDDGMNMAAVMENGSVYTSSDGGVNWIDRNLKNSHWSSIASSADGKKLVAAAKFGFIYTSADFGATWKQGALRRVWDAVASSKDGQKLVAAADFDYIYTSTDGGATWVKQPGTLVDRNWTSITSSADGMKLAATGNSMEDAYSGLVYLSKDGGVTWTVVKISNERIESLDTITSSSDGSKIFVGGQTPIFGSNDGGLTWTKRTSSINSWTGLDSSGDGNKIVGVTNGDYIYISTDGGNTWVPQKTVEATDRVGVAASANIDRFITGTMYGDQIYKCTYVPTLPSTVDVTYPKGGEKLSVGKSYNITWKTTGPAKTSNVQIGIVDTRFSTEAGDRREQIIAQSIANTGKYTWKVPASVGTMDLTDTDSAVYKIIVHSYAESETGVGISNVSGAPFAILNSLPAIKVISPASGLVGTKIKITGSGFKLPNKVTFVGSTNPVVGSATNTVSLINGEAVYKNVVSLDGKNLTITIPSKMDNQKGEDSKTHPGPAIVPGNYYIIIETSEGKSKPAYFKVIGNGITPPVIVYPPVIPPPPAVSTSTSIVVMPTGIPFLDKMNSTPGGATSSVIVYSAGFGVTIVNPLNKDVVLGTTDSSWPVFGTTSDYVQIYKNGAPYFDRGLTATYGYSATPTLVTAGKGFTLLAGGVADMSVVYRFMAINSGADVYQVKLKAVGWGTDTKINQISPIDMSTNVAIGETKQSQTASVSKAFGNLVLDFWDWLGWFK